MLKQYTNNKSKEASLDMLVSQLNIMLTKMIFNDAFCSNQAIHIADKLKEICGNMELTFFPEQQTVYYKMLNLWIIKAHKIKQEKTHKM